MEVSQFTYMVVSDYVYQRLDSSAKLRDMLRETSGQHIHHKK